MGLDIHSFLFLTGSSRGDEGVADALLALLPITWRSSRKAWTVPCRAGRGRRPGAFRDTAGGARLGVTGPAPPLGDTARARLPATRRLRAGPAPAAWAGQGRGEPGPPLRAPIAPRPCQPSCGGGRSPCPRVPCSNVPSQLAHLCGVRHSHPRLREPWFPRGGSAG